MKKLLYILLITTFFLTTAYAQNEMTLVGEWYGEGVENYFGQATTFGDFDDDGCEEFIVGAWGWNTNTGKNYFFQYDNGWPTDYYMTVQGDTLYEQYGYSDCNLGYKQ